MASACVYRSKAFLQSLEYNHQLKTLSVLLDVYRSRYLPSCNCLLESSRQKINYNNDKFEFHVVLCVFLQC